MDVNNSPDRDSHAAGQLNKKKLRDGIRHIPLDKSAASAFSFFVQRALEEGDEDAIRHLLEIVKFTRRIVGQALISKRQYNQLVKAFDKNNDVDLSS